MKIIELSRKVCRDYYGGNYNDMITLNDGVIFDDETIRKAFNFGAGTVEHFKEYMQNNRTFCRYYDIENRRYL